MMSLIRCNFHRYPKLNWSRVILLFGPSGWCVLSCQKQFSVSVCLPLTAFTCICCHYTVFLFWQLYKARAGSVFHLPVYVLFWSLEKCYPEGLLDRKAFCCFSFSLTQLLLTPPSSSHSLISLHLTLTFFSPYFCVSHIFSHLLSLFHITRLFLTSVCPHKSHWCPVVFFFSLSLSLSFKHI